MRPVAGSARSLVAAKRTRSDRPRAESDSISAVEQSEEDAGTDASGDGKRCCAASGSGDGYAGPAPGRVAVHGVQQLGERRVVDLRRQRTGGLERAGFPQTRPVHGRP